VGGRETSAPASKSRSTIMPRYYFHIDDDRTHIDRVGVELPDLEAARDEAVGAAGQILRDGAAKNLWSGKPWRMWVTQSPFANEKPLFVLRFSAAEE
jgi:ABC-type taurine transport system substrate-binding protein